MGTEHGSGPGDLHSPPTPLPLTNAVGEGASVGSGGQWLAAGSDLVRALPGSQTATFLLCSRGGETDRETGLTLMTSFNLNPLLKGPVPKYSHVGIQGFNTWIWGDTAPATDVTVTEPNAG